MPLSKAFRMNIGVVRRSLIMKISAEIEREHHPKIVVHDAEGSDRYLFRLHDEADPRKILAKVELDFSGSMPEFYTTPGYEKVWDEYMPAFMALSQLFTYEDVPKVQPGVQPTYRVIPFEGAWAVELLETKKWVEAFGPFHTMEEALKAVPAGSIIDGTMESAGAYGTGKVDPRCLECAGGTPCGAHPN